jgi:hypothetical protein
MNNPDVMAGGLIALVLICASIIAGELQARGWSSLFTFASGTVTGLAIVRLFGVFW